jgi:hypothetical protein
VVSDALRVGDARVGEEGPGARAAAAALRDGKLTDAELRSLDVGWVLVERTTRGAVPLLPDTWRPAFRGPELELLRAPDPLPEAPRASAARTVGVAGAHVLALLVLTLAAAVAAVSAIRAKVTRGYRSSREPSRP